MLSRALQAITPATIGILLGGVVAACLAAQSRLLLLLAIGASLYLLLLLVVVTAVRPRRAAVWCIAALAVTLTWTGIGSGVGTGLSVAELAPLATIPLALVVSDFDLGGRTGRQWAALSVPVLMTLGGVLAATAPEANSAQVITFAVAAISLMGALFVLMPNTGEVHLLIVGLVSGVLISTVLGLVGMSSPSGRAIGLTTHSNQYAMAAVTMLPLLGYLITERVVPRLPAMVAALVLLAGIFESGSRSGLLALVVVGLLVAYRFGGASASAVYTLLVLVVYAGLTYFPAVAGLPAIARSTGQSSTQGSDDERIEIMERALETLLNGNYVVGTGFVEAHLPHNIILFVWGGFGLLGLVGFTWLVMELGGPVFSRRSSPLAAALALGCLGFLTAVAFNNSLGASFFWLIAGVSLFRSTGQQYASVHATYGSSTLRTSHPADFSRTRGPT